MIGVLFSFDRAEHTKLDKAEGVGSGYQPATATVINDKGRRRKVLTYLDQDISFYRIDDE
ncbi:gamma-glutamylcyclotransferase [Rhizobium leguminosarum]|nr:gamma-glutamylcyclotransferase [Rhizobium leguminosarum]